MSHGRSDVWAHHYLSVFENSLGSVEQQKTNVAVSEAEVTLQDLQHVDPRPHGQRRVTAEWMQPSQEVVWSHRAVAERGGWEGQQSDRLSEAEIKRQR